jgi:hypothetical protein
MQKASLCESEVTLPCREVPCPALPCPAVSCRVIPSHVMPCCHYLAQRRVCIHPSPHTPPARVQLPGPSTQTRANNAHTRIHARASKRRRRDNAHAHAHANTRARASKPRTSTHLPIIIVHVHNFGAMCNAMPRRAVHPNYLFYRHSRCCNHQLLPILLSQSSSQLLYACVYVCVCVCVCVRARV